MPKQWIKKCSIKIYGPRRVDTLVGISGLPVESELLYAACLYDEMLVMIAPIVVYGTNKNANTTH